MKLNLGCGNKPIEGWVNHDITKHSKHVEISHDLNLFPWPWENESFQKVAAISVLEHLTPNLLISMNEVWRILKPGGIAIIKLPNWKHDISWNDPTHLHKVGAGIFDQLDPRTKRGHDYFFYTDKKWKIIKFQVNKAKSSFHWTLQKMGLNWDGNE